MAKPQRKGKQPPAQQDFVVEVLGEPGVPYFVKIVAHSPKEAANVVVETSKLEVLQVHRIH